MAFLAPPLFFKICQSLVCNLVLPSRKYYLRSSVPTPFFCPLNPFLQLSIPRINMLVDNSNVCKNGIPMKSYKAADQRTKRIHLRSSRLYTSQSADTNLLAHLKEDLNSFRLPKIAKDCLDISQINYLFEVTALLHY